MNTDTTDFFARLDKFAEEAQNDLTRTQQELREIDLLIRQSTAQIEPLAQRNAQIKTRVAQMEADINNYSREEIRSLYTAERESQLRLFMMRNEVGQLQGRQKMLEKYNSDLTNFVGLAELSPNDDAQGGSGEGNDRKPSAALFIGRVIEAEEEERKQLARQMHDGPAQSLTNLILHAEICERLFDADLGSARQELGNLRNFANGTFQKVRDFIFELRPMMLDDLGLAPTLRRYLSSYEEKTRVKVNYQLIGQERRLPSAIEITLFRATQELLHRAVQGVGATQVNVTLDMRRDEVMLTVEDNGPSGDNPVAATPDTTIGITAMRDRVTMLEGDVTFERPSGHGTRVQLRLPLPEESTALAPTSVS